MGAHYDSVPGSPGTDDNASGVAALLEISRLFAAVVPSVAVRFVAFVSEEAPFFLSGEQGSMMYAGCARARGDDIRLMLSLEMLGYCRAEPSSQRYPPFFRADESAVASALLEPWSNGQTEGQIIKLKLVKRQMYAARNSISSAQDFSALDEKPRNLHRD